MIPLLKRLTPARTTSLQKKSSRLGERTSGLRTVRATVLLKRKTLGGEWRVIASLVLLL